TSPPGTARANAGVLGTSGVRELFPAGRLNNDWQSGLRVSAGGWLSAGFGIGGRFFYLADQSDDFTAFSPGTAILSRPFVNPLS
ncbi:BBP7 family outer membrane beta-barrel protein, partial [Salmonella sp. SAL4436]|uniref:BBP7 family outer membrane beta-barrel protein n=1 Tax=Salmonella sp. SAL4436 TaxID=3159891 RepID=UPI00397DC32A